MTIVPQHRVPDSMCHEKESYHTWGSAPSSRHFAKPASKCSSLTCTEAIATVSHCCWMPQITAANAQDVGGCVRLVVDTNTCLVQYSLSHYFAAMLCTWKTPLYAMKNLKLLMPTRASASISLSTCTHS
jgi:hypothetical protein